MSLPDHVRDRIDAMVAEERVVLFMKGTKVMPQCGFSATVTQLLKDVGVPFKTHNVLADHELREGIKAYSDWPTIPQLYVDKEFVGGCDIVRDMHASGQLHALLGVAFEPVAVPALQVSEAALAALRQAGAESPEPGQVLRLEIDPNFRHDLYFGGQAAGDVVATLGTLQVAMDSATAKRANGLQIDFQNGPQGPGFRIANPNAPEGLPTPAGAADGEQGGAEGSEPPVRVREMTPAEMAAKLKAGEEIAFFDCRGDDERATAKIAQATQLTPEVEAELVASKPKDTVIVFHCHHGGRSGRAAERLAAQGFTQVYNLVGGIDRWSLEVDDTIPRY